ncbi:MAG: hypothetical protein AAFY03_00080 [Pseudomonadota bacterium]
MIWIVYVLSAMWSIGWVGFPIFGGIALLKDEFDRGMGFAVLLIGTPLGAVFAVLPWEGIAAQSSPDLATLKKGEWACTQTKIVNSMMPVSNGKTTTMVPTTSSVCVQYSRTAG